MSTDDGSPDLPVATATAAPALADGPGASGGAAAGGMRAAAAATAPCEPPAAIVAAAAAACCAVEGWPGWCGAAKGGAEDGSPALRRIPTRFF